MNKTELIRELFLDNGNITNIQMHDLLANNLVTASDSLINKVRQEFDFSEKEEVKKTELVRSLFLEHGNVPNHRMYKLIRQKFGDAVGDAVAFGVSSTFINHIRDSLNFENDDTDDGIIKFTDFVE